MFLPPPLGVLHLLIVLETFLVEGSLTYHLVELQRGLQGTPSIPVFDPQKSQPLPSLSLSLFVCVCLSVSLRLSFCVSLSAIPSCHQNNALYSRSVPGAKNKGRNALNALALVVGGGGGQPLGDGDKEVILHLNKEICSREWDHSQVLERMIPRAFCVR